MFAHFLVRFREYTANEGPVRIQYKWLVPIYVFPDIKLFFPKQNYIMFCLPVPTLIYLREIYIYISRISMPILLAGNMWTDPGNI
jgi:hypothetical protein